jgi:hypothetical protein
MTYGLEGRRSIQLSYGRCFPHEDQRPKGCWPAMPERSIGALGFEPRASCSQSRRANRAALRPAHSFVYAGGPAELPADTGQSALHVK